MSFQDNNDSLTALEKTLKVSEALQKKFQLPKSLEKMLNSQKKIEQIYSPSFSMRELFKQQEQLNKAFELPKTLQKVIDQQQKIKSLFPEYFKTTSSLIFPQSIFGSQYSWHSLLATTDNISTLQSISKSISKQYSSSPATFFSDYGISALLNIQKQMQFFPTEIQNQLVDDVIYMTEEFDVSEEVQSEVSVFFKDMIRLSIENLTTDYNYNAISQKAKFIISYIYQYYIVTLLLGILSCAIYEYQVKPKIDTYFNQKEIKTLIKQEVKRNDLLSLYGERITSVNVNLRVKPDLTSELIEILDRGTFLHIINDPQLHKSWLKVEVDMNGEKVQGYILRRYTFIVKP
ncbi:SH3 domain-containing protein [Acinetobacter guillouiae]|uniref:SH3 domain-containing protein n=1 Tax=Acinetobacter guillouiae TaxID=106649 RepID=UPI0012509881|nr:SH3 domain-containing protein [Acinetobacter guillouiae]